MAQKTEFLQFFWDLASLEDDVRHKACTGLVVYLRAAVKKISPPSSQEQTGTAGQSPYSNKAALARRLGLGNELQYTVGRLVKGLASSRDCARIGFANALACVLREFKSDVTVANVVDLCKDHTSLSAAMKGQEERDALFGRVFCCAAIQQSGRLCHDDNNKSSSSSAVVTTLIRMLIEVASKKHFLRELSFSVVEALLLDLAPTDQNTGIKSQREVVLSVVKQIMPWPMRDSPEFLSLAIELERVYSFNLYAFAPTRSVVDHDEDDDDDDDEDEDEDDDAKMAKEGSDEPELVVKATDPLVWSPSPALERRVVRTFADASYTHPRAHRVWMSLFSAVMGGHSKQQKKKKLSEAQETRRVDTFKAWWSVLVEDGLTQSANTQKKYLGFHLLTVVVRGVSRGVTSHNTSTTFRASLIDAALSPCLMKSLMQNLTLKNSSLGPAARHAVSSLECAVRCDDVDDASRLAILAKFQSGFGGRESVASFNFDRVAKVTLVSTLLHSLSTQGRRAYLDSLIADFLKPTLSSSERKGANASMAADNQRITAIEHMCTLLKVVLASPSNKNNKNDSNNTNNTNSNDGDGDSEHNSNNAAVAEEVLKFLLFHSFFTCDDETDNSNSQKKKTGKKSVGVKGDKVVLPYSCGGGSALSPALSTKVTSLAQSRFYTLLNVASHSSVAQVQGTSDNSHLSGRRVDGRLWAHLLSDWQQMLLERCEDDVTSEVYSSSSSSSSTISTSVSCTAAMDGLLAVQRVAMVAVSHMQKEYAVLVRNLDAASSHSKLAQLRALQELYTHMVLQLCSKATEATAVLQELQICYEKVFHPSSTKGKSDSASKKKAAKGGDEDDADGDGGDDDDDYEESGPVEVLTDILISLLAKPSSMLREVVNDTFRAFSGELTPAAMDILLDVVCCRTAGAILEDGEYDDDEEMDGSDDESDDESGSDDSGSDDSGSDDDDESGDDDDNDGGDDGDDDDEDDDDSDHATDEQMMAMDKGLSAMFSAMKAEKASKKDLKLQETHLKFKVLDLLEMYAKRYCHQDLFLMCIQPLYERVKMDVSAEEQTFLDKLHQFFVTRLCRVTRYPKVAPGSDFDLLATLEIMIDDCVKASSKRVKDAACAGVYLVLRIMAGSDVDGLQAYVDGYLANKEDVSSAWMPVRLLMEKALSDQMTRHNSSLPANLLSGVVERVPAVAWLMVPALVKYTTEARSTYLKAQAYTTLAALFKKKADSIPSTRVAETLPSLLKVLTATLADTEMKSKHLLPAVRCVAGVASSAAPSPAATGATGTPKKGRKAKKAAVANKMPLACAASLFLIASGTTEMSGQAAKSSARRLLTSCGHSSSDEDGTLMKYATAHRDDVIHFDDKIKTNKKKVTTGKGGKGGGGKGVKGGGGKGGKNGGKKGGNKGGNKGANSGGANLPNKNKNGMSKDNQSKNTEDAPKISTPKQNNNTSNKKRKTPLKKATNNSNNNNSNSNNNNTPKSTPNKKRRVSTTPN